MSGFVRSFAANLRQRLHLASGARRLPVFGSSSGASNADIRLSPLRRHFVPPKVGQVPIPLQSS
jgi:hypothetical protein